MFLTDQELTQVLYVSDGKVGIGTPSPGAPLDVAGSIRSSGATGGTLAAFNPSNQAASVTLGWLGNVARIRYGGDGDGSDGGFDFQKTNNVSLMRLLHNGNVGIGRTPTTNDLEVEGTASKDVAGDWLANSDRRIKKEVETIDEPLATLEKVRLVSFRYTDEYRAEHPSIKAHPYLNVIAQEFAEVFPNHVKGSGETVPGSDEEILQVDTYPLTIYSAAAIQELHGIVKDRDSEISALQADVAALKETVRKMSSPTRASTLGMATPALAALCLVGFLAMGRTRKGGAR